MQWGAHNKYSIETREGIIFFYMIKPLKTRPILYCLRCLHRHFVYDSWPPHTCIVHGYYSSTTVSAAAARVWRKSTDFNLLLLRHIRARDMTTCVALCARGRRVKKQLQFSIRSEQIEWVPKMSRISYQWDSPLTIHASLFRFRIIILKKFLLGR